MTRRFRYLSAGLTHVGLVRRDNEDAHLVRGEAGLWVVADGMGGHENGRWAACQVVAAAENAPLGDAFEIDVAAVEASLHQANQTIFDAAAKAGATKGSTVVALVIDDDRFACLWSGDSRGYRLRNGRLTRLTHDHSPVQAMIDQATVTLEEAGDHPLAHVISHAVGVEMPLWLDRLVDTLEAGDRFLLCSDGLTRVVSDPEIAEALGASPPRSATQNLLDRVLERGAPDNVTIVAVACLEASAPSLAGAS